MATPCSPDVCVDFIRSNQTKLTEVLHDIRFVLDHCAEKSILTDRELTQRQRDVDMRDTLILLMQKGETVCRNFVTLVLKDPQVQDTCSKLLKMDWTWVDQPPLSLQPANPRPVSARTPPSPAPAQPRPNQARPLWPRPSAPPPGPSHQAPQVLIFNAAPTGPSPYPGLSAAQRSTPTRAPPKNKAVCQKIAPPKNKAVGQKIAPPKNKAVGQKIAPPKKTPAKRKAPPMKTPAKKKAPPKKTPAKKKAPPKKTPAKKKAPPKKTPAKKKAPPKK